MSPSITQLRDVRRVKVPTAPRLTPAHAHYFAGPPRRSDDRLLEAQRDVLSDPVGAMTAFSPSADDDMLAGPITDAAAHATVPLVIGSTRDEMQIFNAFDRTLAGLTDDGLRARVDRHFGPRTDAAIAAYRHRRPGASPGQLASAVQTDETFRVPARRLAEARVDRGTPTWMYWFTWASPVYGGALGSCHGLDIPFAFHNLGRPGVAAFTGDQPERTGVADAFSDALIAFARGGDPGLSVYDLTSRSTLQIDAESSEVDYPEQDLRELWDGPA
jgi:carboxylesterase type B